MWKRTAGTVTGDTQSGRLAAEDLRWPSLSLGSGANPLIDPWLTDMGETSAFHCNLAGVQPQGTRAG